jgi:hypothetical protein
MPDNRTLNESRVQGESLGFDVRHPDFNFDGSDLRFREAIDKTFWELEELLLSKHKDYGPKNIADAPGGAINGLRVRMHDKMARINNLYEYMEDSGGFQPQHESIEDSFKDMANYAVIGLLVLRGQWPSK